MIRHRQGGPARSDGGGGDSSDDDDDAFSALAMKRSNKKAKKATATAVVKKSMDTQQEQPQQISHDSIISKAENETSESVAATATAAASASATATAAAERQLPLSTTSSMKRHHKEISDSRKAKMDALLMELEKEKQRAVPSSSSATSTSAQHYYQNQHVPEKKGSFVAPGEESVTTNLFVGNLAPSISEEDLTELFRQFGDLYSVKIMWPRTSEERARQRHTGFVCFMNRQDAEDALQSCDNADPFNVGRRITLRWGKNVKKIVKKGAGGTLIPPIQKQVAVAAAVASTGFSSSSVSSKFKDSNDSNRSHNDEDGSAANKTQGKIKPHRAVYNDQIHRQGAIRVVIPQDAKRAQFISTIASFVAKDGSALERALVEREGGGKNPAFDFLSFPSNDNNNLTSKPQQQQQQEEHIFYKWRVYAFCQGDGYHMWQMNPFIMFEPHGCFWIPPPMDQDKAQREKEQVRIKEEAIAREKQQRRLRNSAKRGNDYVTGRKLEQAARNRGGGPDGGAILNTSDMLEFHRLFREQLCASREAICEAMAFCFEKSAAAKQLSDMLKTLLLELGPGTSVETRIARLYLLSDILFNTQQPGVRLAFFYRDAIERMAPEVFTALGKKNGGALGRMSLNKLANAVSSVLSAWTNWSVYDPAFLDELQSRFEGREIKPLIKKETEEESQGDQGDQNRQTSNSDEEAEHAIITKPQGEWREATDQNEIALDDDEALHNAPKHQPDDTQLDDDDPDGAPLEDDDSAGDPDGAPLEDDEADGAPLEDDDSTGDPDGAPLMEDDDPDGAPLEDDDSAGDPDGTPLMEDEHPDGAPLEDDDPDGAPLTVDDTAIQQ